MVRFLACVGILGFLFVAETAMGTLAPPPMTGDREVGAAVATRGGAVRWTNKWTMERATLQERPAIHFTETGEGIRDPFEQQVHWTIHSWWAADADFLPLRSSTSYSDSSGRELMEETKEFLNRNEVRFVRKDLVRNKTTTETLDVPSDTLIVEGIAGALRTLPFNEKEPFAAHLLTNEPKVYSVTFEMRGRERLRSSGKTVDAFKVELVPHLGILSVFRFFYPKSIFWFSVEPNHPWIRYEGLENGPGSPEILMEAVPDAAADLH